MKHVKTLRQYGHTNTNELFDKKVKRDMVLWLLGDIKLTLVQVVPNNLIPVLHSVVHIP